MLQRKLCKLHTFTTFFFAIRLRLWVILIPVLRSCEFLDLAFFSNYQDRASVIGFIHQEKWAKQNKRGIWIKGHLSRLLSFTSSACKLRARFLYKSKKPDIQAWAVSPLAQWKAFCCIWVYFVENCWGIKVLFFATLKINKKFRFKPKTKFFCASLLRIIQWFVEVKYFEGS